jgi:trimethylamine--corrinoid protein Co-methyltransferase
LRTRFLDHEEEDLIHESSLKTLREMGVMIHSSSVLAMLEKAGASVDPTKEIAKIPESLVREALAKAPKRFRYCARDSKHEFEIPTDTVPFGANNGLAIQIADLETGAEHSSTSDDLATFTRLADALDPVDYVWASLTTTEVPVKSHAVHELWVTLQNTVKHVEGASAVTGPDARLGIALASLVAGGPEELRKRPILSAVTCPIAPLTFEKGAVEAQVEFARAGVPVLSMSMSLGGTSSPVTIAGTITNLNTENLASLVIDEIAAPGAPHVYTTESTPVDMKTGHIDYTAAETPLISAAAAQMARRYGLPCYTTGWGVCMGQGPGLDLAGSQLASVALAVASGPDLFSGLGGTDAAKGVSYEQLVIDAYLWEDLRGFLRTFTVSEDTIALDVVRAVGHGSTFLRHPHTVKHFRKELFFRDAQKLAWEATLSNRMVPEAREIARRLLKEHEVPPLDRDVIKEGDALVRDYESRLART